MVLRRWVGLVGVVLSVAGCFGERGMDRVISMKSLDRLEEYAKEMAPEEAEIFEQTVLTDIRVTAMQVGLANLAESFKTKGDPSRDANTSETDAAIGRMAALEGKTVRAATIENLQAHRTRLQAEKEAALAEVKTKEEIQKQLDELPFLVSKVEIERRSDFGRMLDGLMLKVGVIAPEAPAVFVKSFAVSIGGDGGAESKTITIKHSLTLPCSACEIHLYSSADSIEGYAKLPRNPAAFHVKVQEWGEVNQLFPSEVNLAELDQRLATLDRKIALVSKGKN